jgi:anti-sigma B factor antagonist
MDIQINKVEQTFIVSASGKIDAMTSPSYEASIAGQIEAGSLSLVLDLGGVDYISSAGLRVILAAAKSLKNRGGSLLLANARGPVKEVFDISGFGSVFKIFDSVDAAVSTASR